MDFEKIADNIYKSVEARIANATAPLISELDKHVAYTARLHIRIKELEDKLDKEMADLASDVQKSMTSSVEMEKGKDGAPGEPGPKGADGIGLAGAFIDRDGTLVLTMTNGEAKSLGVVVGRNGTDGRDGKDGLAGQPGEKGIDGVGLAGAMLDRDGVLLVTLSNGETKSLGQVVGKDGSDGKDGISFESFDLEYLSETHEVCVKASIAGRTKELRYPAGGIRPAGYWREGTKAVPGEAWVHGGSLWICMKNTEGKPATNADAWIIAARAGKDGERGATGKLHSDAPIKLVN